MLEYWNILSSIHLSEQYTQDIYKETVVSVDILWKMKNTIYI